MSLSDIVEMRAETDEERILLHHVRGNAHEAAACPLCKAQHEAYAHRVRIESLVTGAPLPDWVLQRYPVEHDRPKPKPLPLGEAVDLFHEAIPREAFDWRDRDYNVPRLRVVKWLREQAEQQVRPDLEKIAARFTSERVEWLENH